MAQAFEIPTGNRTATGWRPPAGSTNGVPGRAFQIVASGRPDPSAGSIDQNMGLPSARRKRANPAAAGLIPGLGDPTQG
jgi:hypothetical protein